MSNEKEVEEVQNKEGVYHIERGSKKEEVLGDTHAPQSTNSESTFSDPLQEKVDLFNKEFAELQNKHGFAVVPEIYTKDGVLNARVSIAKLQ